MNIHIDNPKLIDLLNQFDSPSSFLASLIPVIEYCSSVNSKSQVFNTDILENLYSFFPDHYIHNNDEYFSITHHSSPPLFIQQKSYNFNVPPDDTNTFINLCKSNDVSGIFCSQHSGIANHPDLSFQVYDTIVIVFIHNLNQHPPKIKYAHKIISCLTEYIDSFEQPEFISIDPTQFETIKQDFEVLSYNINKIEKQLKECTRSASELHINSLQRILQDKASIHPCSERRFTCHICNRSYKHKTSLTRHLNEIHAFFGN